MPDRTLGRSAASTGMAAIVEATLLPGATWRVPWRSVIMTIYRMPGGSRVLSAGGARGGTPGVPGVLPQAGRGPVRADRRLRRGAGPGPGGLRAGPVAPEGVPRRRRPRGVAAYGRGQPGPHPVAPAPAVR